MKITIVSAVYPPEPITSAITSYNLAVELTQRNHHVCVITNFPSRSVGKRYQGEKRSLYSVKNDPVGFRVVRCFSFISRKSSMLSRWIENISFGLTTNLSLLFSPRPDIVYSNTWPVFATGLVCLVCKIRHIPLVLSIQDMYPESLVTQGRLKPNQWLYIFLLSIDRWITRQAAELIVLSDQFAQRYIQTRHMDPAKMHTIANWIDQNSIILMNKNDNRKEMGISEEAFVIVYGGTIGKAAGVDTIIEAMDKLNTKKEIILLIAGSGSELPNCQKLSANIKNAKVVFHTPWKPEETSSVLATADVLILPTQGTQSLVSVPSKLLSYLLAAKPVLAMVLPESETAHVIEIAGCGWVIPPDNVNLLVEKIKEVVRIPLTGLEEMGLSGREYALKNFAAETSLPKIVEIIEKVHQWD